MAAPVAGPAVEIATDNPRSFADLFLPLVLDARGTLEAQLGPSLHNWLTPAALGGWEDYLLRRLLLAGVKAADWQFQIHRTVESAFAMGAAGGAAVDAPYQAFIGREPRKRLQRLWQEFPGLEALCATLVANWLSTVTEFVERLQRDALALEHRFPHDGSFALPVVAIEAGLSDPHSGGRCVAKATFPGGGVIIYKPRALAVEDHLAGLLERLNSLGPLHPLRAARCWNSGTYGWMEHIAAGECSSPTQINAFYWRTGVLLGLIFLARGVDFHCQNLIAAGEHPVIIDAETLWHPQEPIEPGHIPHSLAALVRTGFLPYEDAAAGFAYQWNTLSSTVEADSGGKQSDHHLPTFGGKIYPVADHVADVQAGFRWLGETLLGTDEQAPFENWLRLLRLCPRRLLRRSTTRYRAPRAWLTSPQTLRSMDVRWEEHPNNAPSLILYDPTERAALEVNDIPYFEQPLLGADTADLDSSSLPTREEYLSQTAIIAELLGSLPGAAKAHHSGSGVHIK